MAVNVSDPKIVEVLHKGMGFNPIFKEGKKLQASFIWMAKKNGGKTKKLLDTFRGRMLIFSMDNQTEIIVAEKIKQEKKKYGESFTEKNVIVANFFPSEYGHIRGSGDERRLEIGYSIIKDMERMIDNVRSHGIHFDYIVVDGYPELKDRINEYMRKCAGLTLTEKILGNDLDAYGHRNRFYQTFTASIFELSDICPVITTYPKVDLSKAFKGTPPPEPEIDKNMMYEFRNIVWLERTDEEEYVMKEKKRARSTTTKFYAKLQSMKGLDFGEEGTTIDVTGDTPVFPIEKLEAYRKGNPLNVVETREVKIAILDDNEESDTGIEQPETPQQEKNKEGDEEEQADDEEQEDKEEQAGWKGEERKTPASTSFLDDL